MPRRTRVVIGGVDTHGRIHHAAVNQLKGLLVTAPAPLREALEGHWTPALVAACARLRPDPARLAEPVQATKAALQALALRIQALEAEIALADDGWASWSPRLRRARWRCLRSGSGGGGPGGLPPSGRAYDTDTLIGALEGLRRLPGGEKATLLWDGLPADRSRAMHPWLGRQRSWLVVEPLPAYVPKLNPVEPLWASLKAVELAT